VEKFPVLCIENNGFNLRAAEVYSDAKHFQIFRNEGEMFKRANACSAAVFMFHLTRHRADA